MEEILGKYNPLKWESSNAWLKLKIVSFKSRNNFKDPILSHVKDADKALVYYYKFGPTFYSDLTLG